METLPGIWFNHIDVAITVCDKEGMIIEMNECALKVFDKDGNKTLIGCNVLDCHPEPARTILLEMLKSGKANTYTISKNGRKKIIQQIPWTVDGEFAGLVEISSVIPEEMPHFIRS